MDGLKRKWAVKSSKSRRIWVKVDGPKRDKVDGSTKLGGPKHKSGRSIKNETGWSSRVCWRSKEMKVDA